MKSSTTLIALALIVAGFGAGCSSNRSRTPQVTEASVRTIADRGYVTDQCFATTTLRETWQSDRAALDVSFIAPTSGGPYPLIVYLPGLGESSTAGNLWRSTWAAAGYAVFAVQPIDLGWANHSGAPRGHAMVISVVSHVSSSCRRRYRRDSSMSSLRSKR